ncbi:MAG: class I SAM-dependent methyltransferase [Deltaproteobacteria bacterium]|nr:class I SAM-dependent methyltransferase [Deltaproteobacteria bacterium]MBZ0219965.1 class I SAM-dependent methyltransferase [Deltaproteobacteria bacterium]
MTYRFRAERPGSPRGNCNICGSEVAFEDVEPASPRESFRCPLCNSTSRNRFLAYTLGMVLGFKEEPLARLKRNRSVRIFEASGVARYCRYLSRAFDYINAQYDPEVLKKRTFDRGKYADLQSLHYPDRSFDVVIASDVLEHVRLYEDALKEVYRVLDAEGVFLLQVPYENSMVKTVTRVETRGDEDCHLLPPVYHGGRTLVYRDYGRDLLDLMSDIGFTAFYLEKGLAQLGVPRQGIIIGAKNPQFDLTSIFERA